MSHHFFMGAINKHTDKYEYPRIANKQNKYKCPCCERDVIFKHGKINQPHFAHYKTVDNPCCYYDNPPESQIHKDAKLLVKTLLDNKKNISINRDCNYCEQRNCGITENICYDISDEFYNENTKAVIEYRFNYNNSNKSADVALIENDKIKIIFEICYKHKTEEENRPEPWVEINAENLINQINSGEKDDDISIKCIRDYKCNMCVEYEKNETDKMNLYNEKLRQERIEKEKQELIEQKIQEQVLKLREEAEKKIQEQVLKWREEAEKEKERNLIEMLKQKQKEEKENQPCKCDLMMKNICMCKNPKYEIMKISNNLFCINCNKWKCRCK